MSAADRLAVVARLRAIVAETGDVEAVAELEELIDHSGAAGPGQRTLKTCAGTAARDQWLCLGARDFNMAAPELARHVADFQARIWPRERHLEVCPERHRGTIRWHLWHALRAWPHGPKERRLRDIIGNELPDFIAPESCKVEPEREINDVPTDERIKRRGTGG